MMFSLEPCIAVIRIRCETSEPQEFIFFDSLFNWLRMGPLGLLVNTQILRWLFYLFCVLCACVSMCMFKYVCVCAHMREWGVHVCGYIGQKTIPAVSPLKSYMCIFLF